MWYDEDDEDEIIFKIPIIEASSFFYQLMVLLTHKKTLAHFDPTLTFLKPSTSHQRSASMIVMTLHTSYIQICPYRLKIGWDQFGTLSVIVRLRFSIAEIPEGNLDCEYKTTHLDHVWPNDNIHQPRFSWNKGISLTKPPFGVRDPCFRSL